MAQIRRGCRDNTRFLKFPQQWHVINTFSGACSLMMAWEGARTVGPWAWTGFIPLRLSQAGSITLAKSVRLYVMNSKLYILPSQQASCSPTIAFYMCCSNPPDSSPSFHVLSVCFERPAAAMYLIHCWCCSDCRSKQSMIDQSLSSGSSLYSFTDKTFDTILNDPDLHHRDRYHDWSADECAAHCSTVKTSVNLHVPLM